MRRLAVVVAIAVAGFAAAFVAFGDAARSSCVLDAPRDPSYAVAFEEPVRAGAVPPVLRVTRDAAPVTGAWVCLRIEPEGETGAGVAGEARALADGRYAVPVELDEAGSWSGTVLIAEDGGTPDSGVPVTIEVVED